jgi:ribose/xylose/arabinose/galactoside ABC-type transport system permease subunit
MENIMRQTGPLALVAFGQAFVIIGRGLDLSVGSIMGFVAILTALAGMQFGLIPGIIVGLAGGALCGAINGLMVSAFLVPSFVATLGMLSIARGSALIITDGLTMDVPQGISYLGWENIGPFPVIAVVVLVVFLICYATLAMTTYGRSLYATGANEEAARLSGIPVGAIRFTSFTICGILAGAGAILLTARMNSGHPLIGQGYELSSIGAVVLGGVSLRGGQGSLLGVLFGVIFFESLANGLRMIGFSSYITLMIQGVLFILAVWLNLKIYSQRS